MGNTEMFRVFAEHVLLVLVLFVVVFVAIAFAFARGRLHHLLLGFIRTIGSFFSGPFVYLQKAVLRVADYGEKGEANISKSDQYLTNKLLIALQVVLIVVAISELSTSVVTGWELSLPPQWLRVAIQNNEKELDKNSAALAAANSQVQQMDTDWQNRREALVSQFKGERSQRIEVAQKESSQIQDAARTDSTMQQALESVQAYLAQYGSLRDARTFDSVHDNAVRFLDRLSLPDPARAQLARYVDNWRVEGVGRLQLDNVSEAQLRFQIQPDYLKRKTQSDQLTADAKQFEDGLKNLSTQVEYHPERFGAAVAGGILAFIVAIWIIGLISEASDLLVHLASDVRRIRESQTEFPQTTSARGGLPSSS